MSMPETAIYKNNTMVFWQDNIWFSGKIFYMETETKSPIVKKTTNQQFRFGIRLFIPAIMRLRVILSTISTIDFTCLKSLFRQDKTLVNLLS